MAKASRPAATKVDLFKQNPEYAKATKEPRKVELKPARYLAVDGAGAPASADFQAAIGALYGMAYTIKMKRKSQGSDYKVSALEALWWSEYAGSARGEPEALWSVPNEQWRWKLMIMVPDFVDAPEVESAGKALLEKRGDAAASRVHLYTLEEGLCVQILHVGPYREEPRSIAKMRSFMDANRLVMRGLHHEIYLSDPQRVAAEKIRTILRHPVEITRWTGTTVSHADE